MKVERIQKNISLVVADAYLNGLRDNATDLFDDEHFLQAFNLLRTRVNELMDVSCSGWNELTIYAVFECQFKD